MKIAFVANTCWNIYNFRRGLVQYFISNGDKVLVLAPQDEYTEEIEKWGVRWIDTPIDSTGANPLSDFFYLRTIWKVFKAESPDIALSYTIKSNIYSSLACKFSQTKVICNVSGLGTAFLVEGIIGKFALTMYKIAFKHSSYIFFQNEDDKKLFISHVKIPDNRLGVLPGSGIDLEKFKHSPMAFTEKTRFVMISRLIIEKGVKEYAEAASFFKADENICFSLIGKLDEGHSRSISKKELDEWVSKGWINYFPHSNTIAEVIKDSDAIILPSYREGTPRTLLEGASIGRPLLTSDVPGCREVVLDGFNGFLFKVRNSKSIVDKIRLYLSLSIEERKKMGRNSRSLAEDKFDEKIIIDKYKKVIHRISSAASNI